MSNYSERDIFVIHGRNHQIRDSMFSFLSSLDLHPISFEEAKQKTRQGSPYILDILEKAITDKVTIVALFTPDDIAFLNPFFHKNNDSEIDKKPMGQSRQNVIFETGMAFAKNPKRTILIFFRDVKEFSDISGLHYFKFEDTKEKRTDLKNLLSSIGCPIKESSDYLSAGDFNLNPEIFQYISKSNKTSSEKSANISSLKTEIINFIKELRSLSIKTVRNEVNEEDKKNFSNIVKYISKFPQIEAILPTFISEFTDSYDLHKEFKEQGSFKVRVLKITSDFDKTLKDLENIDL